METGWPTEVRWIIVSLDLHPTYTEPAAEHFIRWKLRFKSNRSFPSNITPPIDGMQIRPERIIGKHLLPNARRKLIHQRRRMLADALQDIDKVIVRIDEWPVALQFGSSNFTGAARRTAEAFQYEMDIFLRWEYPEHRALITQFVTQWQVLHAATKKYDADEFNMDLFFETFDEALVKKNEAEWKQYLEEWSEE